jgi:hypothetical protein
MARAAGTARTILIVMLLGTAPDTTLTATRER